MFPALHASDFRLFLIGQAFSQFGNQIQQVGVLWLAYRLSQSTPLLGLLTLLAGLPIAVLAPLIGVSTDRGDPLRVAIFTQCLFALQAALLGGLVYAETGGIAAILVLIFLQGVLNGIDMPLRQILVPRLTADRTVLTSGVALNSMVYDTTRILGPALGGLAIVIWDERATFVINGLAHLVTVGLFLGIGPRPRTLEIARRQKALVMLKEGLDYASRFQPVRAILLLSAGIAFAGSAHMALLPAIVRDMLGGDAQGMGLVMSGAGMGALSAGLLFNRIQDVSRHPRIIAAGAILFGIGLAALAGSSRVEVSIAAIGMSGFGIMLMMAACTTALVELTEPDKHGRVLSLFTLSYALAAPLGGFCAGEVADLIGTRWTISLSSVFCLAVAFWFSAAVRPLTESLKEAMSRTRV